MFTLKKMVFKGLNVFRYVRSAPKAYAILTYHQVANPNELVSGIEEETCVDHASFCRQMEYVAKSCLPISIDDMVNRIKAKIPPDGFYVAITFDDGHLSNFKVSLPVIKKFKLPATFFITSSFADQENVPWWDEWTYKIYKIDKVIHFKLGDYPASNYDLRNVDEKKRLLSVITNIMKCNPNMKNNISNILNQFLDNNSLPRFYMNWEEIKCLSRQEGVSIGAHSVTHRRFKETKSLLNDEILPSKEALEEKLEQSINFYAYPFGTKTELGECVYQDVERTGYLAAFTALEGFNCPGDNLFSLKRIHVVGGEPFKIFLTHLYMADLIGYLKNKNAK